MVAVVSRLRPLLRGAAFFSWLLLFLWSFSAVRSFVWERIAQLPGGIRFFSDSYPVSRYNPESALVPVSGHLPLHPRFPAVEFHGHLMQFYPEELPQISAGLDRTGTKLFINLALRTVTPEQYRQLQAETAGDARIIHFPGLNWARAEQNDFEGMARDLEEIAKLGVKGVKIWKDFGLERRDGEGRLLRIDDSRLDPVWDVCSRYGLIVAMHTADPPAFFHPADYKNERYLELSRRPEWSFADGPTFEELLGQRENLYKRRRDLLFVGQHFGELAHDLNAAARLLDRNPNLYFDTAQRIDELGRQPTAARNFILKYQDRILFGMDGRPDYEKARIYWRFFETADEYFDYHPVNSPKKGVWKIYGINLPDRVLEKLYSGNAERLLASAGRASGRR